MQTQTEFTLETGKKRVEVTAEKAKRVLEIFSADARIQEIADAIQANKLAKKEIDDATKELYREAESLGVPKKALNLAMELQESGAQEYFDKGFWLARRALGIPVQLQLNFEK